MDDHYLVDVEAQVRRIEPDIDIDRLQFHLTTDADGIIHLGWCLHHPDLQPAIYSWSDIRNAQLCDGIVYASTNLLTGACTDRDLANAVDIMLDLDRFSHRSSEEIRSEMNSLQDVADTAFELTRFEDEVFDMFAPAMSAIPQRYAHVLQPIADNIGEKVELLGRETIEDPKAQNDIISYFRSRNCRLDTTPVIAALSALWAFTQEPIEDHHRRVLYAALRSFTPKLRHSRALVSIPRWLYTSLHEYQPDFLLSAAYENLDEITATTALTLWSDETEELYHDFDRCVEAAQLVNR